MSEPGCTCEDWRSNAEHFDVREDEINVHGCCGGGCFVLTEIRYCPWCGMALGVPIEKQEVPA